MDRRTRNLFVGAIGLIVVLGLAFTFIGGAAGPGQTEGRPDGPFVDGVVTRVESTGLASVTGFTLLAPDGRMLAFGLSELRNGVAFPPGHLAEHQATSSRIRVWYREAAGALQALWIEDARAP